jgi:hypothetical protein
MNLTKKVAELNEYKHFRNKAAILIQATFRGYRTKIVTRIMLFQHNKKRKLQNAAATQINKIARSYLAKAYFRELIKQVIF